jgi:hypothetical protein
LLLQGNADLQFSRCNYSYAKLRRPDLQAAIENPSKSKTGHAPKHPAGFNNVEKMQQIMVLSPMEDVLKKKPRPFQDGALQGYYRLKN